MTKVTYIVNFNNKEDYIERVINSFKNLNGNFRKEYFFIDNGSTDNTLGKIKEYSKDLKNVIIISKNKFSSSKYSPISIAQGEFIKFVAGNEVLTQDSTINLLGSLTKYGHRVAFGMHGTYQNNQYQNTTKLDKNTKNVINNPISELLSSKNTAIHSICSSASLFARDLIEEIIEPSCDIISQDMSLILKCATKSEFVFCPEIISYKPSVNLIHNNFKEEDSYNKILAIKKLIDFAPELAEKHNNEIHNSLTSIMWKADRTKYKLLLKYLASKVYSQNHSIENLRKLIDEALKKICFK